MIIKMAGVAWWFAKLEPHLQLASKALHPQY